MFRLLFERSADAMSLFDPAQGLFLESNNAVVEQIGAPNKKALENVSPLQISPERQSDGSQSREKAEEMIRLAMAKGSHRFEWLARRFDGSDLPLDVVLTSISYGDRPLMLCVSRDISEKKRAEAEAHRLQATLEQRVAERTLELSTSEARLRTLVEHAPEAIVVFSADSGRFEMVNENAVCLFGRSRKVLLQSTPEDVSPALQADGRPSADVAREKIAEAMAGGTPVFDWLHQQPNGRLVPCEIRLVRLPSEGRPLVRANIIDTTERRRREHTQRAVYEISEAVHAAADLPNLYARIHRIVRSLMPAENFFIALYDAATEIITFPYYVDEHTPQPPEPRKVSTGLTGVVLRTGRPVLADRAFNERNRKVGDRIIAEALGGVSYVESGDPAAVWLGVPLTIQGTSIGVMAVQDYRDEHAYGEEQKQVLTYVAEQTALAIERKRTEAALRASEAKFKSVFLNSPLGLAELERNGHFTQVNRAFAQMTGRSVEEILPLTHRDLIPREYAAAERSVLESLQHTARFGPLEMELLHKSGHRVPVVLNGMLIRTAGGRETVWAIVEDVTKRKQAETELLRALAREQELSQLKTHFVSTVSHEFRTPLGIILSSSQILADYFDRLDPAERAEHLQSIARNTLQMSSLMEEVLVLSRVDSGRMAFEPAPLDLAALGRRLVDEVLSATHRRCPIRLTVAPDCTEVQADERLLRHILPNLLSNAVKYSAPGQPVDFDIHRQDNSIACRIRDRGIGIPEEDREWLFTAFHRGGNVGDRPGTGLGLTIVQRCVELHRGRIELHSQVNQGTEFTVLLPWLAPGPPQLIAHHAQDSGH